MNQQDQKLKCRDCGREFIFSAGEQEFFSKKGFNPPSRCPECRKKKRKSRLEPSTEKSSGLYEIKCAKCGKTTQVPFRPRNPEGVLCAECFEKRN